MTRLNGPSRYNNGVRNVGASSWGIFLSLRTKWELCNVAENVHVSPFVSCQGVIWGLSKKEGVVQ